MSKKYALDANILISSHRQYYSYDFAPSFWNQLVEKGGRNIVLVDWVRDEIYENDDWLSEWLKTNEKSFLVKNSDDDKVIECYTQIITAVVDSERYNESAKYVFADAPDSWLCAHALANGYVVVTEESYDPNIKKKSEDT